MHRLMNIYFSGGQIKSQVRCYARKREVFNFDFSGNYDILLHKLQLI